MAEVDLIIAGRPYRVACRDGEEESLRSAAGWLIPKAAKPWRA
jgi:cell division protein ZapA (FtsZ GTPase activity inhibitor)